MSELSSVGTTNISPAGICVAARLGNVAAIDTILSEQPELIAVDNPYEWSRYVPRHEIPGSFNKKPVAVAAFFDQPAAVRRLLEISETSPVFKNAVGGYFNSLGVALACGHDEVVAVIREDIGRRLDAHPELINAVDENGNTLLHRVTGDFDPVLVQALVKRGAEVDLKNHDGRRPIHNLVSSGDDERLTAAKLLVDHGADNDLWIATALQDVDRIKQLLEQDPSLANKHYRPDQPQWTLGFPLVKASGSGNREIVELLLDHGADVNAPHPKGRSGECSMPVMAAVGSDDYEMANLLLDRGARADAHGEADVGLAESLYTALINPKCTGSVRQVIARLLDRVLLAGGRLTLFTHIRLGNHMLLGELLSWRDDVKFFEKLTHEASWLGSDYVMELCLNRYPNLQTPANARACIRSALNSHNRDGDFASYRKLIDLNLRSLVTDHHEFSKAVPLHWLATCFLKNRIYGTCPALPSMNDLLNLAELFLDHGADLNQRHAKSNRTAIAEAADRGYVEYVAFLLDRGADRCIDDAPNTNPTFIAGKHGFVEIVQLLQS